MQLLKAALRTAALTSKLLVQLQLSNSFYLKKARFSRAFLFPLYS